MKKLRLIWIAVIAAPLFAGCAGPEAQPYYGPQAYSTQAYQEAPASDRVGTVERIEVIRRGDRNNVAGTVIGGIVGGLIGHQIGHGGGQTAATVVGAAGGAVAGHEIQERSRRPDETFRVTVRYPNGAREAVTQADINDLRPGDRVRVEGGRLYPY